MGSFDFSKHELTAGEIFRNLPPNVLYEHAIRYEKEATIAANGALVAYSGEKTGRSPKGNALLGILHRKEKSGGAPQMFQSMPKSYRMVRHRAPGLSERLREALPLRWLRWLESKVQDQGPSDLHQALSRAIHAHDAYQAHTARIDIFRAAGFCHL